MITVIEQNTSERNAEIAELFNQIQPLLDEGYSFSKALISIGRVKSASGATMNPNRGWYRHLIQYAKTQGYDYRKTIWR